MQDRVMPRIDVDAEVSRGDVRDIRSHAPHLVMLHIEGREHRDHYRRRRIRAREGNEAGGARLVVRVVVQGRVSSGLEVRVGARDLQPCATGRVDACVEPAVNVDSEAVAASAAGVGGDADVAVVADVHGVDSDGEVRGGVVGSAEGDDLGCAWPGMAPVVHFAGVEIPDGWVGDIRPLHGYGYGYGYDGRGGPRAYNETAADLGHELVDEIASFVGDVGHLLATLQDLDIMGGELRHQFPERLLAAYERIGIRVNVVDQVDDIEHRRVVRSRGQGIDFQENEIDTAKS